MGRCLIWIICGVLFLLPHLLYEIDKMTNKTEDAIARENMQSHERIQEIKQNRKEGRPVPNFKAATPAKEPMPLKFQTKPEDFDK